MDNLSSLAEIYQLYELAPQFENKEKLWSVLALIAGISFIVSAIFSAANLIASASKFFEFRLFGYPSYKEMFLFFSVSAIIAIFSCYVFAFSLDKDQEIFDKKYENFFHSLTVEQKQLLNKDIYFYLSAKRDVDLNKSWLIDRFNRDFLENEIKSNSSEQLFSGKEFRYFLIIKP